MVLSLELSKKFNLIPNYGVIENLHTLIKNNGQDFNLTKEQLELANMLS